MSRIIIGVDGSERAGDAIAFGGLLARAGGVGATVAHAYAWQPAGLVGTLETSRYLLDESDTLLSQAILPLEDLTDLEIRSLTDSSAPRALQELADELDAGLIVVGSSHHGRLGRVFPGSTAERLLHGSPCPVAVVPHGYRDAERHDISVIACGWNGTTDADAALAAAEALAIRTCATLRVIHTFETPTYYAFPGDLGMGYAESIQIARDAAQQSLDERVARLSPEVRATGELNEGSLPEQALVAASVDADLLVLGSRGYGPLKAVLLGGVSGLVVREAACPVIVIPNGADHAVASVLGTAATLAV